MNISRLKEIREDNDVLQKEVADVLGIPQQNYSRYEIGAIAMPMEKYNILANYYNTSVDYLIGRTDERKPYPKSILNKKK